MGNTMDFTAILDEYAFQAPCEVEHRESGMNNTTRMIASGTDRYVLRIYNNHKDENIVRLEHEVLAELQKQELPFHVPIPVRNKRGDTVCIAPDGTLSALYYYIDGDRPSAANTAHISALGKTAALLTAALSEIKPIQKPLYSPYYSLESTYMSMDETAFVGMAGRSPALAARRSSLVELQEERHKLKGECETLALLPQQWIHGDLVLNNTVSQEDTIVGVLDFEFSTVDVRAMELAVIVVDLIKPDDPSCKANVKLLLKGYRQSFQLTEQELEKLPSLMKLRLLDVVLHFASRFRDGLDDEDVLCGIIDQSAFGCKWINDYWEDVKL